MVPWRVRQANMLGVAINGGILRLVFLGVLSLNTANKPLIADVVQAVFCFLLSLLLCVACNCLLSFTQLWWNPYAY